jgi:serine/threonine-protein kinase RsbW
VGLVESVVIGSNFQAAREVQQRILAEIARHGYDECSTFAIRLAMEEGLSNAIRHGNKCDPKKQVEIEYDIDDKRAVICIADQGPGFTPDTVPDPTADENLEKPSGRGIMLIQAYMDKVEYNQSGNRVRMTKFRDA